MGLVVIGLVGGVASGKSQVAKLFEKLGAKIVDADQVGHEVLRHPDVIEALAGRWGKGVVGTDGQIDRSAVARIVFAPEKESTSEKAQAEKAQAEKAQIELAFLQSVTHPRIANAVRERMEELARQPSVAAVVLDAPVMLEAGWDGLCDKIVYVSANRQKRFERALQRGWTAEQFAAREAAQLSLEEKQKVADGVIDNSGSMDHTFAQVRQFWRSLSLSPPN